MSARLRVGVDHGLAELGRSTGHGRTWYEALTQLAPLVDLVVGPRNASGPAPDVWLADGHHAPPAVDQPIVSIVHDVRWTEAEHRAELPVSFLAVTIPETELAIAASTVVVAPSSYTRRGLIDGYGLPTDRVVTVPLGVDARVFRPGLPDPAALGLPGLTDTPYVCFVGAAEPRKRVDVVRDAVARLADVGLPHRLVLRAAPPQSLDPRPHLRAATAELPGAPGRVTALARVSDDQLAAVLGRAAVFVLPSVCEGFGLPALEAMACGIPVVVADRTALPEVVGDAGLVVEPDPAAVADAIARLAADAALAGELGRAARARAETMTWAHTAQGYRDALEVAAAHRPVGAVLAPSALASWAPVVRVDECPVCGRDVERAPVVSSSRARLIRCPSCAAVVAGDLLAAGADRLPDGSPRVMPADWPGVPLGTTAYEDFLATVADDRLRLLTRARSHAPRVPVDATHPPTLAVVGPDPEPLRRAAAAAGWEPRVASVDAPVDALVAAHVVDRCRHATRSVGELAAQVRPGGLLLLEVPNWGSAVRRRDLDGWHQLRPLEHATFFDRSSARALLVRAGLEPITDTVRTRVPESLVGATHPLPPLRRFLRRAFASAERGDPPQLRPGAAHALRAIRGAYDRAGAGDVIVVVGRVPEPATAPRQPDDGRS